jgi:NADH-quinone oxidoreductase subunit L
MEQILKFFILLPFFALLANLFVAGIKERILSGIAIGAAGLHLAGTVGFIGWWATQAWPTLDIKELVLYKSPEFEFFINFYFDKITAVFLFTGSVLIFLVTVFSKFYLHREEGFKRFFNTLLVFFAGYNLVVLSGNFETLFIGWEMLGLSSFLLIAFYRDRYLPVKNGLKVLSFYRLGDICLILAMWMSHHLWHTNITFAEWDIPGLVPVQFQEHYEQALFIAVMIFIAAAIKSAQLPFSSWLPRAMEGPTSSSAIFYGSLSVHIGVFLLLRTYLFWESEWIIKSLIIATGLITAIIATSIARVQSSVKTQIAYSSITQIGLIFIEVALGFHTLALIHFAGNALMRTYQLLVSPSVLGYLVHDMFFNFSPVQTSRNNTFVSRIKNTTYILSVKEWNLDFLLGRYLWRPFKWAGEKVGFIGKKSGFVILSMLFAAGIAGLLFKDQLEIVVSNYLTLIFSSLALLLVLTAFAERGDAKNAWKLAIFSQFFTVLSLLLSRNIEWHQIVYYLSGTVIAGTTGYFCLRFIKSIDQNIVLNLYHGYSYERPGVAFVFLLSCLGLSGFPITPTFIGVDLLFTHIHANQVILVAFTALNFLFLEMTILRIYTRIFLGQHKKMDHPIAFKSS